MTNLVSVLGSGALSLARARRSPSLSSIAIWLGAALIATFFALVGQEATVVDGAYLPRGNDSFYHARRILDAAVGARGFYQFDERLNAPDGSWIPWPWGYDYLMAKATQLAMWLFPALDPMAFISHVPVAWILVNSALFLAVAAEIGLSREMRVLAMLSYALSPLTQMLHSLAMIDHHYVEHTFVLLNAWLGLRWFKQPDEMGRSVALGVALGVAPAFHNGLFVLQVVPLIAVFVLWLRGTQPSRSGLVGFAVALVVTTQIALLPSEPYRRGMFEYGLLSWFHFYVAACTAVAMAFMAWRSFSRLNLALFAAIGGALAIPVASQLLAGVGFVSGNFSILGQIVEVHSPYRLFRETLGPVQTAGYYSWLLLLGPALLAYYGYRIWCEARPERLYYAVAACFGLGLLLAQWRLQYFGFFALVTGGLLLLDELRSRHAWHRGVTFVVAFAVLVLAYQPALRTRLFALDVPGGDFGYANILGALSDLQALCAQNPGTVLASSSDGAAILFHTECSVIATNFILTPEDAAHIDEVGRLMASPPAQIRAQRPDVEYMLARTLDFAVRDGDQFYLATNNPVVNQLLLADAPPEGFTLVTNIVSEGSEPGSSSVYARLFAISPQDPPGP